LGPVAPPFGVVCRLGWEPFFSSPRAYGPPLAPPGPWGGVGAPPPPPPFPTKQKWGGVGGGPPTPTGEKAGVFFLVGPRWPRARSGPPPPKDTPPQAPLAPFSKRYPPPPPNSAPPPFLGAGCNNWAPSYPWTKNPPPGRGLRMGCSPIKPAAGRRLGGMGRGPVVFQGAWGGKNTPKKTHNKKTK